MASNGWWIAPQSNYLQLTQPVMLAFAAFDFAGGALPSLAMKK
jgi:hypothetical protein